MVTDTLPGEIDAVKEFFRILDSHGLKDYELVISRLLHYQMYWTVCSTTDPSALTSEIQKQIEQRVMPLAQQANNSQGRNFHYDFSRKVLSPLGRAKIHLGVQQTSAHNSPNDPTASRLESALSSGINRPVVNPVSGSKTNKADSQEKGPPVFIGNKKAIAFLG